MRRTSRALHWTLSGFVVPDVMLPHNGCCEIWYLKEVFPEMPLIGSFEFFIAGQVPVLALDVVDQYRLIPAQQRGDDHADTFA